jgi:DNA primase
MNAAFESWVERARNVPIEREIERRGVQLNGGNKTERSGPCPVCGGDDRFSINTKKQVFNCRGCGKGGNVIALVEHLDGIGFIDACTTLTGEPPPPKGNGRAGDKDTTRKIVVATFEYHDQNGDAAFAVDRIQFQKPDGTYVLKDGKPDKVFRRRRPDPDHPGQWIHNTSGAPVVPYRLPGVLEALVAGHPILIVEGEAKADLLASWNVAATCNAGGSKKWKPEHSEYLRDADVVLLPDNDNVGWEHIHAVGASLVGIAKRVRVLVLPNLAPKGDIIDWAKAGGTREQLDALLTTKAPDWGPPTAEELKKEKTKEQAREDELLDQLAKMKGLELARERKKVADELGVTPTAIDAELNERRSAAPLYGHWVVEPWPEPADGDSL